MNVDVFLLFFNVLFTMLCAAGIVLWILRREYLPVIRRLEREVSAEGKPAAGTESPGQPAGGH